MTAGQNRIPVNLDYAASTPMRAEALLAQREYDDSELAGVNPNSLHSLGRKAAARLEVARREIARSFGAHVRPSEIVLTNGGTEAICESGFGWSGTGWSGWMSVVPTGV